MTNFSTLEEFNVEILKQNNHFEKIRVSLLNLQSLLHFLKNNAEFAFDRLNTIIAVDLEESFELIYDLYSTELGEVLRISVIIDRNAPHAKSVVNIFKSAYFDECEIYDLFGIDFDGNRDLKRLLMPKGWIGHPLRKDYVQNDERLVWND
jgi:NADH-quinone oxidoreductase subunit C